MSLHIDDYSIDELLDLIHLSSNQHLSPNIIKSNLLQTKRNILQELENPSNASSSPSLHTLDSMNQFIENIGRKLYSHYGFHSDLPLLIQDLHSILNNKKHFETLQVDSHQVVEHSNTTSVNSRPLSYNKGQLNPLYKQTYHSVLTINSKFRKNYIETTPSNFRVDLTEPFKNVYTLKLTHIQFPGCIYNISQTLKNNIFYIRNQFNEYSIQIPDGYYTSPNQIVEQIQNNVNFIDACGNIEYNDLTCKINITFLDASFDVDFLHQNENNQDIRKNVGYILGFRKGYYSYNDDYVVSSSINNPIGYTSESTLHLKQSRFYLVSVNDYNNNFANNYSYPISVVNVSSIYQTTQLDPITNLCDCSGNERKQLNSQEKECCFYKKQQLKMIQIPLQTTEFNVNNIVSIVTNTNYNGDDNLIVSNTTNSIQYLKRSYYGPVNISKLHIQIYDEFGRNVDLQNQDIVLHFELELQYDL